ncbi:MAG: AcrR family transcriptional regulator [Chlamydiales bacterium]|jgi:AcrR family transcriptional regulator
MTADITRKRILDSAELIFAETGFAGASIRAITTRAGADPGAARYHFGNKDALFSAVLRRRILPLCEERKRLLKVALQTRPDDVERIVEAFMLPAIRLVTHKGHGASWMLLMARLRVEQGVYLEGVQAAYKDLLNSFLKAIQNALPAIPRDEIAYRLHFMFGTQVNTMINDGTLHALSEGLDDVSEDPQGTLERLVRFVSAGMRAEYPKAVQVRSVLDEPEIANGRGQSVF